MLPAVRMREWVVSEHTGAGKRGQVVSEHMGVQGWGLRLFPSTAHSNFLLGQDSS